MHLDGMMIAAFGSGSVYDRHSYADENRRIQEAVAGKIMALAEGKAQGKVVALHA